VRQLEREWVAAVEAVDRGDPSRLNVLRRKLVALAAPRDSVFAPKNLDRFVAGYLKLHYDPGKRRYSQNGVLSTERHD
jgi:hypothetical protein